MYEIVVVGAGGFLGSAVVRAASARGVAVGAFDRSRPVLADGHLAEGVSESTAVVWCASQVNPVIAAQHPERGDADVATFRAVLDALAANESAPRVVLLSSGGAIYGPPATAPYRESDAPSPVNEYGVVKLRKEQALGTSGLDGVALRVANAYGPGQRPAHGQGVLAHWMTAVAEGRPVGLFGDPDATRDYVYVDDIADAVIAAATVPTVPPVVNIGSGEATTLEHLLDALREAVAPAGVEVERRPARATDTTHSVLDVTLARVALGWTASTGLREGVKAMWEWIRA